MMRRTMLLCILAMLLSAAGAWADDVPALSVTGEVRQPLTLSLGELGKLESDSVRLNEVFRDGGFHGVFQYEGPSLRALLELAVIQKQDTDFSKSIDLAIAVRNKDGRQVALSWGEVFYRNPADVIVATQATPVIPHVECSRCHEPEVYGPWLDELKRPVGLPKLVVANDFYTDRCLEGVTSIEVVNLHPDLRIEKMERLFSPAFTISGEVERPVTIDNLDSLPHRDVTCKQAGDGRGYHGLKSFGGVPLANLLAKAGIEDNLGSVALVSAPDGYRSLLSYGELLLSPSDPGVLVADTADGEPLDRDGKFCMVVLDDLSADRCVKAVEKVEVVDLSDAPRLYVIGVGCAEANLITLEAISCFARAGAFVCSEDLHKRFAHYIGDRPVLFDPIESIEKFMHKEGQSLSPKERKKKLREQRAVEAQKVVRALEKGKSVAYLDYGDPMLFGSWRFLQDAVDEDSIEFVPGISSFNAASALLKRDITCNGSVVLTAPQDLKAKQSMLRSVAESGDTLTIFMGLKDFEGLMPLLLEHYPDTTPVALVYEAGFTGKERVLRTTLRQAPELAKQEKEKWLGLIYIGPCLQP